METGLEVQVPLHKNE
ncbi:hypothetical protein II582_00385 [bacterium]|nr:hypothetical protein [bacterium]